MEQTTTTQATICEVKKYFLLANAGKSLFNQASKNLEEMYKRIFEQIFCLNETELDKKITDKTRLSRYNNLKWCKNNINFLQIGIWPKMYSLDARLTAGNVVNTAQNIEQIRIGNIQLDYNDKDEMEKRTNALRKFLEKSGSIRQNLSFLYERFPIILFPGGEIREKDYNVWARKNNSPIHAIYDYDIDDGNNRAVSYALEGLISSPCFYGVARN